MIRTDPFSVLLSNPSECPAWCSLPGDHAVCVGPVGRLGKVGVALYLADELTGPEVMLTTVGGTANVTVTADRAADLAAVFRAAGNDDVAALIDKARSVAAATARRTDDPGH